jgi:hypothetical protein
VGLIYGSIVLAVLAATSYVTATFMIEAIAGVNALKKRSRELDDGAIMTANASAGDDDDAEDNDADDDDRMQTEFMPLMVPAQVHLRFHCACCFSLHFIRKYGLVQHH